MQGGGKLTIETANVELDENYIETHPGAPSGRYVMLAVSDTGVGMDKETQQNIFEPFFTTKGMGKGTGLGLSTVQGIVAQSGGYIDVYSERGHGTTFNIYLPALAEEVADTEPVAATPVLSGHQTVLVVEDHPGVLQDAVAALSAHGYRVLKAENTIEALQVFEQERGCIDLLLTDVIMPNGSGRELADELEKRQPGMRVLFMSGYTDDAIARHGVLEKGAEFIQKPFSPKTTGHQGEDGAGATVGSAMAAAAGRWYQHGQDRAGEEGLPGGITEGQQGEVGGCHKGMA